jgi:predicted dehydrogenase
MAIPVVLIGLGQRGRQWWVELSRDPRFEVVAACDPLESARRAATGIGLPGDRVHADVETTVAARPAAAAAIVATPAVAHAEVARRAVEANLAVLVEKPFALSLADAARLVRLAEGRAPILVGQNFRYLRMFRAARAVLESGGIGAVRFVSMSSYREGHADVAGLADLDGAALWETGVHHLDALRYLLGREVDRVRAACASPGTGPFRGTTWAIILDLADGPLASYQLSWDSAGHRFFERGQQFVARFVGDRGTLHILQRWLVLCRTGRCPRLVRRGPRYRTEESQLLDQLAAAVETGVAGPTSGTDNLHTLAVVEACLRSARTGEVVEPRRLLSAALAG